MKKYLFEVEVDTVVPSAVTADDLRWKIDESRGVRSVSWTEVTDRRALAAAGICPDCGNAMQFDQFCVVSDPPHGREHERIAPAALCGTCETCIEL